MKIQATIAGFAGQPVTLIGTLDESTGVLVMVKEVKYREQRIAPDFALVSNLDLPDMDLVFTDKHLADAIRTYYTRKAQLTIDILDVVRRFEPEHKIERDAVDEGGRRYRISPDIQNGQVAILAAVALAEGQTTLSAAVDMANELAEFYSVTSI